MLDEFLNNGDEFFHFLLLRTENNGLVVTHNDFNVLDAKQNGLRTGKKCRSNLLWNGGIDDPQIAQMKIQFIG